jgi:hypothetical protein
VPASTVEDALSGSAISACVFVTAGCSANTDAGLNKNNKVDIAKVLYFIELTILCRYGSRINTSIWSL